MWGYRHSKLKINDTETEIKLTGIGYEIELDLVSEVVEKKLEYLFLNIDLPQRQVGSSFKFQNILDLNLLFSFTLMNTKKQKNLII